MCDATIIIAAWNASNTVERSISSAFNQVGVAVEVIVVDDASTDDTGEKLAAIPGLVFDRLPSNGGPAAARNRALDLARGRWIAVLDADDTIEPQRLSRMISHAKETDADIVLGNFRTVDGNDVPVADQSFLPPSSVDATQALTLADYVGRNQVRRGAPSIGYLKPILSRSFLERTGLRYDPSLRNGEDCHLILAALIAGAKVVISPRPDYLYTVRQGSISHRVNPSHLEALIAADQAFLNRHAGKLDTATRRLFASRNAGLTEMMLSERVLAKLKIGDILAACRILSARPKTIGRVTRQIGEGLGRRLKTR